MRGKILPLSLLVSLCGAQAAADDLPLFASDQPLDIVFEFPQDEIVRHADDRPVVEGRLQYANERGEPVGISLTMTTRGKSRLEYCRFPPLSINLQKQETRGTVFAGQKKLKLVTHCRSGSVQQRYLLQEYSIYRALNVLTDISFRVRYVHATYRDSEGKRRDIVADGYFIESDNELADRLDLQKQDVAIVHPSQLDPAHAIIMALFEFLIGNTDWSVIKGPGDEECCHNGKVVVPPGSDKGWYVVPYDFDQAGIINTRYSSPAPELGIHSVRQRLYRGRCMHLDRLDATIALFNEHRGDIETALLPSGLDARTRNSAAKYIDDFYRIVNDPVQRERYIENRCLGG